MYPMWLVDVNLPKALVGMLAEFGMSAQSAADRGWGEFTNGTLVEAATQAGFVAILTRDQLFGESAARALRLFPGFSVVLVTIPQLRRAEFLDTFRIEWTRNPIRPVGGHLLLWPPKA